MTPARRPVPKPTEVGLAVPRLVTITTTHEGAAIARAAFEHELRTAESSLASSSRSRARSRARS